ncbi:hypothetical protein ACB092_01G245100 [Castanea dentata]
MKDERSSNGNEVIIADCKESLKRIPRVRIQHCFREANKCADTLARRSAVSPLDFVVFQFPPADVALLASLDAAGTLYERSCSEKNLSVTNDWQRVVSRLPKLSELRLRNCSLPFITPSSLSYINSSKSLTDLDLSFNPGITSLIFPWLFNSSNNLTSLNLSSNQLNGSIPNAFGNMSSLRPLLLNDNQLEGGIPKSLGDIRTLNILDLSGNNLSGQVLEFSHNLKGCLKDSLETLGLHGNQITGSVPNFAIFPSLRLLYLSNNKLSGTLDESIGSLHKLEVLDLCLNMLGGVISEALLSNLTKLEYLLLSYNYFTLKFSLDWVPPFQLRTLHLRCCTLGPNFPNWIKTQRNLIYLDVSSTGISDTIPTWFWNRPFELKYFNLSHNQIKGRLPYVSIKFSNLAILDFSSNRFEGPLPVFSPNLTSINLSKNMFSRLNSFICSKSSGILRHLDLSSNLLSEGIPDCFMQCQELEVLNLASNNLSGEIPHSMVHIQLLDLSNNNISGTIPRCLNNLTAMAQKVSNYIANEHIIWNGTEFRLAIFYLTAYGGDSLTTIVSWKGNVYEYRKNFGEMRSIDLANNKLIGTIPEEISSLTELKAFNLSRNLLTGIIPQKIGRLEQLESLDLSRNRFSGSIPNSMADLHFLASLDLSYNEFSGKIPTGTQLQTFEPIKFIGNLGLYGPPLTGMCQGETSNATTIGGNKNYKRDADEFWKCLYVGTGLGFIVGFWGISGSLTLNRSWRHAYFMLLINLKDWLYVTVTVYKARLQKMFHS